MKRLKNTSGLRRLVACALVLAMVLTMMPTAAFAKQVSPFGWLFRSGWAQPKAQSAEAPAETPVEAPVPVEEPTPEETPEEPAPVEAPAAEAPAEAPAEVEETPAEAPAAAIAEELKIDDDLTVSVEAEEGAFPAGTAVSAEKVALEDVQKAVDEAEDVDGEVLYAVDITFALDGAELQPAEGKTVKVSFRAEELKDVAANAGVVHIDAETETAEKIDTVETDEADAVAFEAEKFSVYAIIDPAEGEMEDPRLKITFMNGDEEIDTVYLKQADVLDYPAEPTYVDDIIYDPGIPQAEGKLFRGWTTSLTDDPNQAGLSIDEVRAAAVEQVNAGVAEGDSVVYHAILVKAFRLYYEDEDGITFQTDPVYTAGDSAETTASASYAAKLEGYGFVGWKVKGTLDDPDAPVYRTGDPITISADTTLVPLVSQGYWLIFEENDGGSGGGASYTPPVFIAGGQVSEADAPAAPTRPGYTFAGWWTGAPANSGEDPTGAEFTFTETLTEQTTVYAKWTPNEESRYKIIVWAQKVTDDKNAAQKTYNYVESIEVTGVATDTPITDAEVAPYTAYDNDKFGAYDLAHGSKGFQYSRYEIVNGSGADGDCVSAKGDTVVNVYYDRKLFTVMFTGATGGVNETYYLPVDSGEDVYGLIDGEYVHLTTTADKWIYWTRPYGTLPVPDNITQVYYSSKSNASSLIYTDQIANVNNLYSTNGVKLLDEPIGASGLQAKLSAATSTKYYLYSTTSRQFGDFCQLRWWIGGEYSYSYNGEPYTGQLYEKTSGNVRIFTGLYGQSFSQYGYEWFMPDATHHWKNISYVDAFNGNIYGHENVGNTPNLIQLVKSEEASNITIVFWTQDVDDLSRYTLADTAMYTCAASDGFNITDRIQGMTSAGYRWSTTADEPAEWNSPEQMESTTDGINANGYTNVKRGDNTVLHIKYDRVQNDIVFMNGNEELTESRIRNVAYGTGIAQYEPQAPTSVQTEDGYYFVGWYEDPEGINPADWSGTMPLGNKTLYAKVLPQRYHIVVVVDPAKEQVPNQSLSFRVTHRTKVESTNFDHAVYLADDHHSLVGWYTDEARTQPWSFDTQVTEDALSLVYAGVNDPLRSEYEDDVDGRQDVVGVVFLYPKWRDDSIAATGGIRVRYEYTDKNGDTKYIEDPLTYADAAQVYAEHAPDANELDPEKHFEYWQLSETRKYYPSQTFSADVEFAELIDGQLVITLTAVLVSPEEETPTHIDWYSNVANVSGTALAQDSFTRPGDAEWVDGLGWVIRNVNLSINEAVDIPACDTYSYPGMRFLGWGKGYQPAAEEGAAEAPAYHMPTEPWLYWDGEAYHANSLDGPAVTQVAADELLPYDDLIAIWEKIPTFTVVYLESDGTQLSSTEYLVEDYPDYFDLVEHTPDGHYYGGYYSEAPTANGWDVTKAIENSGRDLVPAEDAVYYVKAVPKAYLQSYYKYSYVRARRKATGMWVATCLDDTNYFQAGFIMVPVEGDGLKVTKTRVYTTYTTPPPVHVRNTITIEPKNNESGKTVITPALVTRNAYSTGVLPFISVDEFVDFDNGNLASRPQALFRLIPFYTTIDGETVFGDEGYEIQIHKLSAPATKTDFTVTDTEKDVYLDLVWGLN